MVPVREPRTLPDLLLSAAQDSLNQAILHLQPDGSEFRGTYWTLRDEALRVCRGLRDAGLRQGTPLILVLDKSEEFLPAFWGALLAGLVPAPLAMEPERLLAIWRFLDRPPLLVDERTAARIPGLATQHGLDAGPSVLVHGDLLRRAPDDRPHEPAPQDLAYLQFSSGTTGQPKGVELSHANLLANIRQIIAVSDVRPGDTAVTWMPYFHDMGLIGTHLTPLAAGIKQVRVPPHLFAKRPLAWLQAVSRHRGTLLTASNFALALVARRVSPEHLSGLDLSSIRMLVVGAETISPRVCREFTELLAPAGFPPGTLRPAYGLAEACVAVTAVPMGEGLTARTLDREALAIQGKATAPRQDSESLELVDLGSPVPGCELRVVDGADRPVDEGVVGEVQVRGPHVMRGYHRAPETTRAAFCEDWLRTGDRGFLLGGRLTITGRAKDVIFVHGRKHHAS